MIYTSAKSEQMNLSGFGWDLLYIEIGYINYDVNFYGHDNLVTLKNEGGE